MPGKELMLGKGLLGSSGVPGLFRGEVKARNQLFLLIAVTENKKGDGPMHGSHLRVILLLR